MESKLIRGLGIAILTLGGLGGAVMIFIPVETYYGRSTFSPLNIGLGISAILFSLLICCVCHWMADMIDNSEAQTELLEEISRKLSKEKVNN